MNSYSNDNAGPAKEPMVSAPSSVDLIDSYQPGDQLWVSPSASWLGSGRRTVFRSHPQYESDRTVAASRLKAQARQLLDNEQPLGADHSPAMLFGAIPFDIREPAYLTIPQRWQAGAGSLGCTATVGENQHGAREKVRAPKGAAGFQLEKARGQLPCARCVPIPPPSDYEAYVARAQTLFSARGLDKVVLSRALDVNLEAGLDVAGLLSQLAQGNSHGYTYAIPLPDAGVFVGASPELLVRRIGMKVIANPLAGSAARVPDPVEDRRIGELLLQSAKDRHEHAIVVDAVTKALAPLCRTLKVPGAPSLVATDAMWHLSTTFEGDLSDPATTALDLALALHPTPAICGRPTESAFRTILELEPFDRHLFSGFVGWCNAQGDGEWAVSLRCAEIRGAHVRLFAGAGIVAESDPASERLETAAKFRTMLRALGVPDRPGI